VKTYYKTFDTSDEKNNLLAVFKATQRLHLEVQDILQTYIDAKNGADHQLYPNITFQDYLDRSKIEFKKDLSDKTFDYIKSLNLTSSNIASMLKLLENQNYALIQFKSQLIFLL
jgi:hypothetical protein